MSAEERTVRVIKADKSSENSTLRVAAYCRVSTSEEDQLNSFITQMHYYHDFISQSDNMALVDIYADEGITGTSVEKRNEFKRMLNDCRLGKIDRIYVKSVSRFARNALECIESIRLLREYGVSVFFENDRIDTLTLNSELILYVKSAFAQSEALAASKRVSTANRMRLEIGEYSICCAPYGFRAKDAERHSFALIRAGAAERRYSVAEETSGRTARKHKKRQIQAVSGAESGNPKG